MEKRVPLSHQTVFLLAIVVLLPASGILRSQPLTVDPPELNFRVQAGTGQDPPPQILNITSSPSGVNFRVAKEPSLVGSSFLTFSPTSGSTPGSVSVFVDGSGFTVRGTRVVNLRVELPDQEVQAIVPVTIIASEEPLPTTISVTPSTFAFVVESESEPPPSRVLRVRNIGIGTLDYELQAAHAQGEPSGWLNVSPGAGSSSGEEREHEVSIDPTGLPDGSFSASITIIGNADNSPVAIPVSLAVGSAAILSVSPRTFQFSALEGGPNPPAQTLSVVGTGGTPLDYTISSDQPWLLVSPDGGTAAADPSGHLVSAQTAGQPPGVFRGTLSITSPDAENSPVEVAVTMNVLSPGALTASPTRVSFLANQGAATRQRQIISLFTSPFSPVGFSAEVDPPETPWIQVSPGTGIVPAHLLIDVDAEGLPGGEFEATVVISQSLPDNGGAMLRPGGPPAAQDMMISVPVSLTVVDTGPRLVTEPAALLLNAAAGGGAPVERLLRIANAGGGGLSWSAQASTQDGGAWLAVSPNSSDSPGVAVVTADPAGFGSGVFQGEIVIGGGDQTANVPVTLVVSNPGVLDTDQTAVLFDAMEGASPVAPRRIQVLNRASGVLGWSARVREETGGAWLSLTPRNGVVENPPQSGQDNTMSLIADPSGLAPGRYSAVVEIEAATENSPRLLTAHLRVRPAGTRPVPTLDPGGLLFIHDPAGPQGEAQMLSFWNNLGTSEDYQAAASTHDGNTWLSVAPSLGSTSEFGQAGLTVGVDPAGLAPGIYHGLIAVTLGGGEVISAPVTLVAVPDGTGPCASGGLAVAPAGTPMGQQGLSNLPVRLEVQVADGCGERPARLPVLASFSNANTAIPLEPIGDGRYATTWVPRNSGAQTNLTFTVARGLLTESATVVGEVRDGQNLRLSPGGVVDGADFEFARPLTPGIIFSAFGRFGIDTAAAGAIPLPATLSGARMLLGGFDSPFYFASAGQLNGQAPVELMPATTAQFVVKANELHSPPEEVAIAAAHPRIFRTIFPGSPPRAIAQNQDFSRNTPNRPARRGQAVIVYLTGAGLTSPAVATGDAGPAAEPFARAVLDAEATMGGQPVTVLFLGVAPRFVGLFQANLLVTNDVPIGPDIPVQLVINGQVSNLAVVSIAERR